MSIIFTLNNLLKDQPQASLNPSIKLILITLLVFLPLLCFYMTKRKSRQVYLLDFACYKPPDAQKCTKHKWIEILKQIGIHSEETVHFLKRIIDRSGIGDSTYISEAYLKKDFDPCMRESRKEMEMSIFGSIDILFAKTGVQCEDIGILVVNCSIYNTVPCLSSIIVNRYKLKENIISYNVVGMGCSAGLKAIGLAEKLLQVHHNTYALVMSTEGITENCYIGEDRSMLLTNGFFRVGGSAILLSNRPSDEHNCKYKLLHTVHTNGSSSDLSYNSVIQEEDKAGRRGVVVTKDLLKTASTVIESNLIILGQLILPVPEKLKYLTNNIARKLRLKANIRPYIPNYSKSVEIFLPHVGGKPVLDELQKKLGFDEIAMEPARMTSYRFGNTSSSSIWYELAYAEERGGSKKGTGYGKLRSGRVLNVAVWCGMQ